MIKHRVIVKRVIALLGLLFTSVLIYGCKKEATYNYGDKEMLVNVWKDKIIYNETVVLEDSGDKISAKLLFEPTEIISVRDYTLDKEYGTAEYTFVNNEIIRTDASSMPFLTTEQLAGKNMPEAYQFSTYQAKKPGTEILFTEGIGIVMHHIAVTYKHKGTWTGITPDHQATALSSVLQKLKTGKEITVVVNGDSISTGANASGVLGIKPYQDDFPTLFTNHLAKTYKTTVNLINTSVGGKMSDFGKSGVDPNVNNYNPDLVVIGYGMNDGSLGVSPNTYKENIEFMIRSIQARNSDVSIILIATILANPVSIQNQKQMDYVAELESLRDTYGVALLDMSSISQTIFETKKGVDILANNINHPSDFLVRIYAAGLIEIMEG